MMILFAVLDSLGITWTGEVGGIDASWKPQWLRSICQSSQKLLWMSHSTNQFSPLCKLLLHPEMAHFKFGGSIPRSRTQGETSAYGSLGQRCGTEIMGYLGLIHWHFGLICNIFWYLSKFRPLYMFWFKMVQDSEHVENKRAVCLLEITCESGSRAVAPAAGFLGKCARWRLNSRFRKWIKGWCS